MADSAPITTPAASAATPATPAVDVKTPDIKAIDPKAVDTSVQADVADVLDAEDPSELEQKMDDKGLSEKEKKSLRKKYQIKVDGETFEEELDLNDEEAIKKHLQLSKAAQKRMKESSQLKKDVESFFQALQGDTKKVLKELGIDPKKFAEQVINDELEEMQKSPEQKEKEKLMKEVEDLKKKLKDEEEAKKSAEMSKMQEKFAMEIDQEITDALGKNSKLPKSPYFVKRIADGLLLAYKNGYTNVTAKDIIPLIEKEVTGELQEMFGGMPEDSIEAVLGKGNIDRLRKKRLQAARKAVETANSVKQTGNDVSAKKEPVDTKKKSYKDFFGKF